MPGRPFLCRLGLIALIFCAAVGAFCGADCGTQPCLPLISALTLSGLIICQSLFSGLKTFLLNALLFAVLYLSVPLLKLCLNLDLKPFELLNAALLGLSFFAALAFLKYLVSFLRSRMLKIPGRMLSALCLSCALLFPLSVWCYYLAMGDLISSDIILAIFQTNGGEAAEYVISHLNFGWALSSLLTAAVFFIFFKALSALKIREFKGRFWVSLLMFPLTGALLLEAAPRYDFLAGYVLRFTGRQLQQFKIYREKALERQEKLNALPPLKLKATADGTEPGGIYVLVLGESENRDRMSAYGYGRPTTPALLKRVTEDPVHALLFKNAYASFPQTVPALSYALSPKNQYRAGELTEGYSLIELAKKAGFKTYWLSNQRKFGIYETPITVMSQGCDTQLWLNASSRMYGVFPDEELIKRLPSFEEVQNAFAVIHLMGSHQRYKERVPLARKTFSGGDPTEDAYDDSVLYTDFVLSGLLRKFSSLPRFKALVYMSDHGEELNGVFDHNPTKFSFDMVRIPFEIEVSDAFISAAPATYKSLKANLESFWTNDLLFDVMVMLMGIEDAPRFEEKLSLCSPLYQESADSLTTMHGEVKLSADPRLRED